MLPPDYAPMEMRSVAEIPHGEGWQYEPKWDGFRALVFRDGDDILVQSKSGTALARYFPELVAAFRTFDLERFVIDGEIVVPLAGALSFDALQARIHPAASRVHRLAGETPATFLAFDALSLDGADLVAEPLGVRRAALERFATAFATVPAVQLSPATRDVAVVDEWFARVGGALDGVIAKRLDAAYASGRRDAAVKIKKLRTADCVIGGYRLAAGHADRVGSLLLGLYDASGALDYIGFCSAFDAAEKHALVARLAPYVGGAGFSGNAPGATPSRWNRDPDRDRSYVALAPELVVEVSYDQVTGGRMRHGTTLLRWRTDKSPRACTADQLIVAGALDALLDP